MKKSNYVGGSCWISILILLWGMIAGLIKPTFVAWFSLVFFMIVGLISFGISYEKKNDKVR